MFKRYLSSVFISLYWTLVRADYDIDDSNYSVLKFSENPAGPVWGPFGSDDGEVLEIRLPNGTTQTVDATQCYDGTYTYAACSASNNCAVQFSFTGSGITIYVLQAGPQGMSASLSIDSGTATTATLGAPPPPQYYTPRVTLFDVQNIPSGTHTAVMQVLDWNGGFSGMMLDYIKVNQAIVSSPTTSQSPSLTSSSTVQSPSSTSPTSSIISQQVNSTGTQTGTVAILSVHSSQSSGAIALPSSTSSGNGTSSGVSSALTSKKKNNLAAIVGGVIGGVTGFLALLALGFCFRRRRQRPPSVDDRPSPLLLPQPEVRLTDLDVGVDPFASRPSRTLQSWMESEAEPLRNPSPMTNLSHMRVASSGNNNSADSSVPVSIGVAAAATIPRDRDAAEPSTVGVGYPNEKSRPTAGVAPQQDQTASRDISNARSNAVLTDEQADFVNSLFNNNVPAPVVARVLERMLANPQGTSHTGRNDPELSSHLGAGNLTTLPAGHSSDWETTIGTAPPSYDYVRASRSA